MGKPPLLRSCVFNKSQSDTPDSKKAIAVLAFIVTSPGSTLLSRAMSTIQPINTIQPTKITKTLAACERVLVTVKLGINLHPSIRVLCSDTIVAGHSFLHCFAKLKSLKILLQSTLRLMAIFINLPRDRFIIYSGF